MMMKKSFTLIEIVIVVFIIMVLLLLLLNMGWFYIKNIQLRNDKEDLIMLFNKNYSRILSSSYYNDKKYEEFHMYLYNKQNYIDYKAISWANIQDLWRKTLTIWQFSWSFTTWDFIFKSYQMWCWFSDWTNIFTWWNVRFDLISWYDNLKHCFSINLDACKLKQVLCK